jgi:hypothetical protein
MARRRGLEHDAATQGVGRGNRSHHDLIPLARQQLLLEP